jgi:hypothetical protein
LIVAIRKRKSQLNSPLALACFVGQWRCPPLAQVFALAQASFPKRIRSLHNTSKTFSDILTSDNFIRPNIFFPKTSPPNPGQFLSGQFELSAFILSEQFLRSILEAYLPVMPKRFNRMLEIRQLTGMSQEEIPPLAQASRLCLTVTQLANSENKQGRKQSKPKHFATVSELEGFSNGMVRSTT